MVQNEIQTRLAETNRLRQQQVQRAQYEAEHARVRYMRVDPNNRLVADTLETQWNEKLRALAQTKEECERQQRLDAAQLTDEQRAKILRLASDFPKLWQDPKTQDRDRKRMARLLLEDVTLQRNQDILVQLRFKGGATRELRLPLPLSAWALRKTKPEIVAEIDRLMDSHTVSEIVQLLNERAWRSSSGEPFNFNIVNRLRFSYRLKSRQQRLRDQGWLTVHEIASLLQCRSSHINHWRKAGLLESVKFSGKSDRLYGKPSEAAVKAIMGRRHQTSCNINNSQPSQSSAV